MDSFQEEPTISGRISMNKDEFWRTLETSVALCANMQREIDKIKKPKVIDKAKLMESLTAGIAQLQREIDELEGK